MARAKPVVEQLSSSWFYATGAVALATLPALSGALPLWALGEFTGSVCVALIVQYYRNRLKESQRKHLGKIAFLILVAALMSNFFWFGGITGLDPGSVFFLALFGAKLTEASSARDFLVLHLLVLWLIAISLFFNVSLGVALYLFAVLSCNFLLLFSFHARESSFSLRRMGGAVGTIMASAVPFMLLLFFFFPQIGPLWSLNQNQATGKTGISDVLTPGIVGTLLESNEVAFRVKFENALPKLSALYWRALVLSAYDGVTWRAGKSAPATPMGMTAKSRAVHYEITLEPTGRYWLYALDLVSEQIPYGTVLSATRALTREKPLSKKLHYRLASFPRYTLLDEAPGQDASFLFLPRNKHPRAIALAQSWRRAGLRSEALVDEALSLFASQGFVYSLSPGKLTGDPVDQFLFESKIGFCEHFASAFAVLMRASGIPTRIVVGYLGSEYNPSGNYHIVRQKNAHAWNEVWLGDRGWVRVDPTGAVRHVVDNSAISPDGSGTLFNRLNLPGLWNHALLFADTINYHWDQWIVGYSREKQRSILSKIGFGALERGRWLAALIVLISALVATAIILFARVSAPKQDPALRLYGRFCNRLEKAHGIVRLLAEGPLDFSQRAGRACPSLKAEIAQITACYISVRYRSNSALLPALSKQVVRFCRRRKS